MLVDLHVHSNLSDGSLTPEDLIDRALAEHLSIVSLCDHDSTAGLTRFIAHGSLRKMEVIPGVEISAEWSQGNCHILGLGVRDDYVPLETVLKKIRDSRDQRNEIILQKLRESGILLSMNDVEGLAGGDVVARPHIARAMVNKGYADSVQGAFDRYLAKGKPAYVERFRLEPCAAITLLKEAGAMVVLAHPTQLKRTFPEMRHLLSTLVGCGLDGLEVYTPYTTSDDEIEALLGCADDFSLAVSGGSDFHGESKPSHHLGYYREKIPIPSDISVLQWWR